MTESRYSPIESTGGGGKSEAIVCFVVVLQNSEKVPRKMTKWDVFGVQQERQSRPPIEDIPGD
jgi:hypothetical protein